MNNKSMQIFICIFILFTGIGIIYQTNTIGEGSGNYPSPANGDWLITNETLVENETIVLNGNLIIDDGGSLTLQNVRLELASGYDGQYRIEVGNGAELNIFNSNITAYYQGSHYKFKVYGNMTVLDSTISEMWGDINNENYPGGIEIYSKDVLIERCEITNGVTNGIYCNQSTIEIVNCNISNNGCGIAIFNSNSIILNNMIMYNDQYNYMKDNVSSNGIYIENSTSTIMNNTLISNIYNIVSSGSEVEIIENIVYEGWYGIQVNEYSNGSIVGNTVESCWFYGIQVMESNFTVIKNHVIDCDSCGILARGCEPLILSNKIDYNIEDKFIYYKDLACIIGASPTIINCTLSTIEINSDSHPILINTPIESNNLDISRYSTITVKWFLDFNIIDLNNTPISNASIKIISDNKNEAIERTSPQSGYLKGIVLTEFIVTAPRYGDFNQIEYYTPHTIFVEKDGIGGNCTTIELNENKNITLVLKPNTPPKITDFFPAHNPTIFEEDSQFFSVNITDEYWTNITYQWYLNGSILTHETSLNYTFNSNFSSDGIYSVTVIISDGELNVSHEWVLTVMDIGEVDTDNDGIINANDPDDDGDGYNDTIELTEDTDPLNPLSTPPDLDNDLKPDSMDEDRDGDGFANDEDDFPDDPNRWEKEDKTDIRPSQIIGFIIAIIIIILFIVVVIINRKQDQTL